MSAAGGGRWAARAPAEAVAAHAAATPEQPALVAPTASGAWRWASWEWLAWRVAVRAAELASRAQGGALEYPWLPAPGGIVTDLAIQAAGCCAVPSAGEASADDLVTAWPPDVGAPAHLTAWDDAPEAVRWGTLPPRPPAGAGARLAGGLRGGGGAAVRGSAGWRQWSTADLAAAAAALQPAVAVEGRPLALVGGDLGAAAERAWLAWALAAGAVLVLPGDAQLLPWAVAWARPTHVTIGAGELAGLREALGELASARALRRRLNRLRHLLVHGGQVTEGERVAWGELGVVPVEWHSPAAPWAGAT
jgi:hypothetical protein